MKKLIFFTALLFCSLYAFSEKIQFHADMMTGNTQSKSKPTKLIGHAYVKTDTMEITADSISMSGEDYRFILAEGNVSGKNTESQMDFTCGKLKFDRQTKIARLEDSVTLKDIENDVDAKAQIIDYNQNTEIAVLQINVSLKQKDNTCTSAYAIYKKTEQILEMSGNPKIVQGEDTFRAQEITLNLDTQEITLDGRVSGSVTESKKEDKGTPEDKGNPEDNPPPAEPVPSEEPAADAVNPPEESEPQEEVIKEPADE